MAWNLANNYQSLTQRATLGTVNKALGDLKQSIGDRWVALSVKKARNNMTSFMQLLA